MVFFHRPVGNHAEQQVFADCGSDLVLQADAAGEGNPTGLQTGVGVRTLEVDVAGPVLVALNSTALKLQTQEVSPAAHCQQTVTAPFFFFLTFFWMKSMAFSRSWSSL